MKYKKLTKHNLQELIDFGSEGSFFDFKAIHYKDKLEKDSNKVKEKALDILIKDILALANANIVTESRYIIIGISDDLKFNPTFKAGEIPNKLKIAKIQKKLIDKNINRNLTLHWQSLTLSEKENVDILHIMINLKEQPYFLNDTILHTRVQDQNTKLVDYQLEQMFRRRLISELPPKEKLEVYLQQPAKWIEEDYTEHIYKSYYHEDFPEFTIKCSLEPSIEGNLDWSPVEKNNKDLYLRYFVFYHQTILHRFNLVLFENNKSKEIVPQQDFFEAEYKKYNFFYFLEDSFNFYLREIMLKRRTQKYRRIHHSFKIKEENKKIKIFPYYDEMVKWKKSEFNLQEKESYIKEFNS